MSLYGVMRTGVSGMSAQSNKLSTVSDNIANVNTTGYKRASTEFSSLILKSGSGNYDSGAVETHGSLRHHRRRTLRSSPRRRRTSPCRATASSWCRTPPTAAIS